MQPLQQGFFQRWAAYWRDIDRFLALLLAVFIFLNPLPHTTSIKEVCFYSALIVFAVVMVHRRQVPFWRSPLALPLILISLWSFIGLLFALDLSASVHDVLAHWLKYIGLYLMLIHLFNDLDRLNVLAWLMVVSGTIYTIGAMVVWYIILAEPLNSRMGDFSTMGTTIAGFVILLSLILALLLRSEGLQQPRRWSLAGAALILAAAAALTQSRGTLLAMAFSLSIFYLNRIGRVLVIWGLIAGLSLALPALRTRIYQTGDHYGIRAGLFYYSMEIIKDHPIFGTGFAIDTFRDATRLDLDRYMSRIPEKYQNPVHPYWWPHNMFFSVAVRLGVVGVGLFAFFWVVAMGMAWGLAHRGGNASIKAWGRCMGALLVMFFTKALFDPFETHMVETILFTILAMLTVIWRHNQPLTGSDLGRSGLCG